MVACHLFLLLFTSAKIHMTSMGWERNGMEDWYAMDAQTFVLANLNSFRFRYRRILNIWFHRRGPNNVYNPIIAVEWSWRWHFGTIPRSGYHFILHTAYGIRHTVTVFMPSGAPCLCMHVRCDAMYEARGKRQKTRPDQVKRENERDRNGIINTFYFVHKMSVIIVFFSLSLFFRVKPLFWNVFGR